MYIVAMFTFCLDMPGLCCQVRASPSSTTAWAVTTHPSLRMGRPVLARRTPCRDPCQQRCRTTTHRYSCTNNNIQLVPALFLAHMAAGPTLQQQKQPYAHGLLKKCSSSRIGHAWQLHMLFKNSLYVCCSRREAWLPGCSSTCSQKSTRRRMKT